MLGDGVEIGWCFCGDSWPTSGRCRSSEAAERREPLAPDSSRSKFWPLDSTVEAKVRTLVFAVLLAGCARFVPPTQMAAPFTVVIEPVNAERVVLRLNAARRLRVYASAAGLRSEGGRIVEFVAPGTLQFTGGEGELELETADPGARFVLSVRHDKEGVVHAFETRGHRAAIRLRRGQASIEGEDMTMRMVRSP